MEALDLQFSAFFVVMLAGMAVGLAYDACRALRSVLSPASVTAHATDLTFGLAAIAALGVAVFLGNWGDPRLYVFLALSSGLACYFKLASDVCLPIFLALARLARRSARRLRRLARLVLRRARSIWTQQKK